MLHPARYRPLTRLTFLTLLGLACSDGDADLECFVPPRGSCPASQQASLYIELSCGETLRSVASGPERQGDSCCYEVDIERGECPPPS